MQPAQSQKGADFRALHEGEAFIIPNPWDAGSAKVLEALGFKALATTSSGFAFTLGRLDGATTLDEVLDHVRLLDRSIEDYDPGGRIYSFDHAVERVAAACEASHRLGIPFILTARAENLIRGKPDLDDTIARLQAYERAGADVLYAPGLRSADEIRAVCDATSKPVNVLAHAGLSMREIVDAGARRISVGGALAWASVAALVTAGEKMRDDGDFSLLAGPGRIKDWL